jgi:hypothetical protein
MDKASRAYEEEANQNMVIKLPKSILDFLNSFKTFMAQRNGAKTQHGNVTRMWNQVMVKLGVLGIIPMGVLPRL